jgi:hypothetical protein
MMNAPVLNEKANPAVDPKEPAPAARRKRRSLSIPQRKLEIPEMPGYHLHWFLEANVPAALAAWYEPVTDSEVSVNQQNVGNDSTMSGNADLGTGVKVMSGIGEGGRPEYLVLMKVKEEYWREDQAALEKRNADIMSAIFQKEAIMGSDKVSAEDRSTRYVRTALFQRPTRKG